MAIKESIYSVHVISFLFTRGLLNVLYTSIIDEDVHPAKELHSLLSGRCTYSCITQVQWKNPVMRQPMKNCNKCYNEAMQCPLKGGRKGGREEGLEARLTVDIREEGVG